MVRKLTGASFVDGLVERGAESAWSPVARSYPVRQVSTASASAALELDGDGLDLPVEVLLGRAQRLAVPSMPGEYSEPPGPGRSRCNPC